MRHGGPFGCGLPSTEVVGAKKPSRPERLTGGAVRSDDVRVVPLHVVPGAEVQHALRSTGAAVTRAGGRVVAQRVGHRDHLGFAERQLGVVAGQAEQDVHAARGGRLDEAHQFASGASGEVGRVARGGRLRRGRLARALLRQGVVLAVGLLEGDLPALSGGAGTPSTGPWPGGRCPRWGTAAPAARSRPTRRGGTAGTRSTPWQPKGSSTAPGPAARTARHSSPRPKPGAERHPHLGGRVWFSGCFLP